MQSAELPGVIILTLRGHICLQDYCTANAVENSMVMFVGIKNEVWNIPHIVVLKGSTNATATLKKSDAPYSMPG
jgi:hypothetical protein